MGLLDFQSTYKKMVFFQNTPAFGIQQMLTPYQSISMYKLQSLWFQCRQHVNKQSNIRQNDIQHNN